MKRARLLILVPVLLALVSLPTAAAPLADPCPPGTAYHPACDVDDNGVINIDDIIRTASRWLTSGPAVSDNNHTHLGQQWTGANNPLALSGSFAGPDYAPLVLGNGYGLGHGLRVTSVGLNGVDVYAAGEDGFYVHTAGSTTVTTQSAEANGFEVAAAQGNGLFVGQAGENGVEVNWATMDGLRVVDAGDDGIQLGGGADFPAYGLFVPEPGTTGSTMILNTAQSDGEWALITPDKIQSANVTAESYTLLAVVAEDETLEPGDLAGTAGMVEPSAGGVRPLLQVQLAGASAPAVVGVVESRMALQPAPGKEGVEILHSVDGPARTGDFVAITVLGVAQAKVQDSEAIQPGQRLTVADAPGHARALRTVQVEGITVDESGPTLGVALEAPKDGLVWVLVNPQ